MPLQLQADNISAPATINTSATTSPQELTSLLDYLPDPVSSAVELGGPVSVFLLFLSLISLSVIVFKSIQITQVKHLDRRKISQSLTLWDQARYRDAANSVADCTQGLGRILWIAMQGRQTSEVKDAHLREEIQRLASNDIESLRRHLRLLDNIGTISPLLGLFGTVLGMIEAFRQMETAGSQVDPAVLSGGIWQALLTTGVGLAVAIPTVLAHQWLERRVDRHVHTIEDSTTQVFTANTVRRIESSNRPAAQR